jgi:hypothetical protein
LATESKNEFGEFPPHYSVPTIGCPAPSISGAFRQNANQQMGKIVFIF